MTTAEQELTRACREHWAATSLLRQNAAQLHQAFVTSTFIVCERRIVSQHDRWMSSEAEELYQWLINYIDADHAARVVPVLRRYHLPVSDDLERRFTWSQRHATDWLTRSDAQYHPGTLGEGKGHQASVPLV